MLEKNALVNPVTGDEANRKAAAAAANRISDDLAMARSRRKARAAANAFSVLHSEPLPFPPPPASSPKQDGFSSYVRRLERAARAGDGTADAAQAAAVGPAPARLGNLTESRAAFTWLPDEKGEEYHRFRLDPASREYVRDDDPVFAASVARKARYGVQGTAARLLGQTKTPRDTVWRVVGCAKRRVGEEVSVLHSASVGKAHFGGLMICGSVWTCPPCAAKVSERRKQEIKGATDLHIQCGGALYMITHTFSHQRHDELAPMLAKFTKARQHMRAQRAYKNLRREMGYIGDVRTLEVTYGDANGFHPHEHDLWLVSDRLTRDQVRRLQSVLFTLWERACRVAGLGAPNRKRGVNVIEAESAAEYMAKFGREPRWGLASELTKQHVKAGRAKSMTPFDLLRAAHEGDGRFGPLFVQFAQAFFGKRQVVWSDGLKAMFGIDELTDEQVAAREAEDATVVMTLTALEWRAVLRQSYDQRSVLLELAEGNGGAAAIRAYLVRIMGDEVRPSPLYDVAQPVDLVPFVPRRPGRPGALLKSSPSWLDYVKKSAGFYPSRSCIERAGATRKHAPRLSPPGRTS